MEFGHHFARGDGTCIDAWGSGAFVIEASGKSYRFEDSDRFGPSLIKRNGDFLANPYPPERSPFWRAHRLWVRQGRRVTDDGVTCVWHEPTPTKVVRLSRRASFIIENGEEDGVCVEVEMTDEIRRRLSK